MGQSSPLCCFGWYSQGPPCVLHCWCCCLAVIHERDILYLFGFIGEDQSQRFLEVVGCDEPLEVLVLFQGGEVHCVAVGLFFIGTCILQGLEMRWSWFCGPFGATQLGEALISGLLLRFLVLFSLLVVARVVPVVVIRILPPFVAPVVVPRLIVVPVFALLDGCWVCRLFWASKGCLDRFGYGQNHPSAAVDMS